MRTIKAIHKANYAPIADLITHNPLPSAKLRQIDPFIFLNHHGPQVYKPNNNGLPFGPHPHRGMETVTVIIDGDIMHKDSKGHVSVIEAGGIQWMTAGSGLIHAEVSSDEFKKKGGNLEILQLWLNLPAKHKMTAPFYKGLQKNDIPEITIEEGVKMNLISGTYNNTSGAFESMTNVFLSTLYLEANKTLNFIIPTGNSIFFYVIKGQVMIGGEKVNSLNLIEFNGDSENLAFSTTQESIILFGHAKPFAEPMVAQGPFVMNTQEEIIQAYQDYQNGKFGAWKH